MRAVFHILSVLAMLPYVALAGGFLILGHAIQRGSIFALLDALLESALWLLTWGGYAVAGAAIVLAALGLFPQARWAAALCGCLVSAAALLIIALLPATRLTWGEILFLSPCAAAFAVEAWLLVQEWPYRALSQHGP